MVLLSEVEQFFLELQVLGDGQLWYEVEATVTATTSGDGQGNDELTVNYVGPGANADSVQISLTDTTITGGDSVLVRGDVFENDAPVANAPVSFLASDPTKVAAIRPVGLNQAWVVAPPNQNDNVTITAIAQTTTDSVTASGILRYFARPDALVLASGNNQIVNAGALAGDPLVVQVLDAAGNPYTRGFDITFAVASGPPGTMVTSAVVTSEASGLAQTMLRAGTAAGTIQVTATAPGVSGSPVTFSATVNAPLGPAIQIVDGDNQTATVATILALNPSVRVVDILGQPDPGVDVTFSVAAGGGSVTGATVTTDGGGIATVGGWTLGQAAGTNLLTASAAGLASVTFTATGTADVAASVTVASGDDQTGTGGVPLSSPLVVQVQDQFSNGVPNVTVDWTTSNGSFNPTSSQTDAAGRAQSTWTLAVTPTTQTASATVSGLPPVTFTATINLRTMAVNDGNDQIATVGTTLGTSPSVIVRDGAGNPEAGVTVTFAVQSGGGSVTGGTAVTDAGGIARVGGWTLGQTAGTNTLEASAPGVPPVTVTATGTPDVPAVVTAAGGDGQSADAGAVLTNPLVASVEDQYGNGVPSVAVTWAASDGTVNPTSGTTNAAGQVQTSWTLGTNQVNPTASATVIGLQPAIFNATAVFSNPTILLNLVGTTRVPVGESADIEIILTAPAGVGGVTVTVTADDAGIVAIPSPTVVIPLNQTTGQVTVNGVSGGATAVRASATGYQEGVLAVRVALEVLSLPASVNVPFGATTTVPIVISTPAPTGGEVITLVSDAPTIVSVLTPTVTIPEGQQLINGTVEGLRPGSATLTATSTNYGSAQAPAQSAANLNILQPSATLNESFTTDITIQLESGGSPIPAPTGGVLVTLTPADPACVGGQSVTIPGGLVSTAATLAYGGSATTPCTTAVTAGATDIATDVINVTVNPNPPISLFNLTVGAGLHVPWSGSLGASNHNGVNVNIISDDPNVARIAPNASTPGSDSISIFMPTGLTSFSYDVQGVEGQTGAINVRVHATGFTNNSHTITVVQPGVQLIGVATTTTTLSSNDNFYARVGVPNAGQTTLNSVQQVPAGAPDSLTVTFASSQPTLLQLARDLPAPPVTGATLSAGIETGQANTPTTIGTGGVAYDPLLSGTSTISATIPGFVSVNAVNVTITAPGISTFDVTVGSGLHVPWSGSLAATNHGGVNVTIVSDDPAVARISGDANTPGVDSIDIPVADLASGFSYDVQGVEGQTGAVNIRVRAPGFMNTSHTVTVVQPGVQLIGVAATTTTLSSNDNFYARVGVPNAGQTTLNSVQQVRAGAPDSLTVTFTSNQPTIVQLARDLPAPPVVGGTLTAGIEVGQANTPTTVGAGGVAYDPLLAGTSTISASIPGFVSVNPVDVNVTAPTISTFDATVGSGLHVPWSGVLGAINHGGVNVTIVSDNPAVARVSANASTPGVDSIDVFVANGFSGFSYNVQGIEGQTGSVNIRVRAAGFVNTSHTVTVVQPGVQLIGVPAALTTLSPNSAFYARVGLPNAGRTTLNAVQGVRAGAPDSLIVTMNSTAPTVVQLVRDLPAPVVTGPTLSAGIESGQSNTPTSLGAGGIALDPLTVGSTDISAAIPGFVSVNTVTVTVNAPTINLFDVTVGSGLQQSWSGSLGASNHGGVTVTLTSSNPSLILLAPDANTIGLSEIDIVVPDGIVGFSYYVQAVENQLGTPNVTAQANGFVQNSHTADVVTPAFELLSLNSSYSAGATDDVFWVRIGVPNSQSNPAFMSLVQGLRAGATAVDFTITSSDAATGLLVLNSNASASISVNVTAGQSNSPTSGPAAAFFRAVAAGTTTVEATRAGGFFQLPNAIRVVTVNP